MKRSRENEGGDEESSPSETPSTQLGSGRLPKYLAKKLKKQRRREEKAADQSGEEEIGVYPYTVDDDDHCESPLAAYEDISPILDAILAKKGGKSRSELVIYDPYFCEGAMKQHLASLKFDNVYNKREDFYKVVDEGRVPEYDVLVTNPPYSGNHPQKLMDFVTKSQSKPYLLLMPNWVYTKDYYHKSTLPRSGTYYVSPKTRYLYTTPKGRRQKKSGKVTSPFPTLWYCGVPSESSKFVDEVGKLLPSDKVDFARETTHLPLSVAHESDARKKKERNKLKRKKNKSKSKQQQAAKLNQQRAES